MKSWITPYLKRYWGRIFITLLFGLLGLASGAMLLFLSGYLISKTSLRPENIMLVYVPIVAVRATSIGRAVFLYLEKLFSHDIVLRILRNMRMRLYKILEPQALFLPSKHQSGDLLGVLADDIEHLQDLYIRTIFPSILGIILYSVVIFIFGIFDLAFALMSLFLMGVLVFLVPFLSLLRMKTFHHFIKKDRNRLYQKLTDAIFGMADWNASGRVKQFLCAYDKVDRRILQTMRKIQHFHLVRDLFLQLILGFVVISTMIWSSSFVEKDVFSPTVIAAFTLMMLTVTEAFLPLSEAIEDVPNQLDAIERITSLEEEQVFEASSISKAETLEKAHFEISEVYYRYPEGKEDVLKGLSLDIPQGKKIAILGRSGVGKSTLLKMIGGFLEPTRGKITLNGQDVAADQLMTNVSILNQKPHLFHTTIRNNIRIARENATDEEIMEVVKKAQLEPLIQSLPKGLDTPMLEMGSRFSGGERQRIAFARVLLQQTPLIILDEPTIGLDPIREQELLQTIFSATESKTVLWITHHLYGLEAMDEIIFLKDGKIFMQGSHEQLMEKEPYYRKLYTLDR